MTQSYLWKAATEPANLIGGIAATILTVVVQDPAPLLIWVVVETAYLLCTPSSAWYAARQQQREENMARMSIQGKKNALIKLHPEMEIRFNSLVSLRQEIAKKAGRTREGREVAGHLDTLLKNFLQIAQREREFREILSPLLTEGGRDDLAVGLGVSDQKDVRLIPTRSIPQMISDTQSSYDKLRAALQEQIEGKALADTIDTQQRLRILEKKRDQVGKLGKMLMNLNYQLQLLEETIHSVSEEISTSQPSGDPSDPVPMAERLQTLIHEIDTQGATRTGNVMVMEDDAGNPHVFSTVPGSGPKYPSLD